MDSIYKSTKYILVQISTQKKSPIFFHSQHHSIKALRHLGLLKPAINNKKLKR